MSNVSCPFCGMEDKNIGYKPEYFADLREAGQTPVTVCTGCLEPSIIEPDCLRKPTFEEYNEMMVSGDMSKITNVRETLRKIKEEPHALIGMGCWTIFKENTLPGLMPRPKKQVVEDVIRMIFMAGFKAGSLAVDQAAKTAVDQDHYDHIMNMMNSELEFHGLAMHSFIARREAEADAQPQGNRHERRSAKHG